MASGGVPLHTYSVHHVSSDLQQPVVPHSSIPMVQPPTAVRQDVPYSSAPSYSEKQVRIPLSAVRMIQDGLSYPYSCPGPKPPTHPSSTHVVAISQIVTVVVHRCSGRVSSPYSSDGAQELRRLGMKNGEVCDGGMGGVCVRT
ncbi:hypothetical protein BDV41DRAFT_82013 [Aspergillus transmontanensis]|uniref:Uncharacterized protein n=1 Tax=Aspergillus transmontanensis TaxID=1034304 RepID=A0A5N6VEV6_9EURO|nr:hypothetical protein BDV41DRAFT_82013 [Aspergillus transmontanensis]